MANVCSQWQNTAPSCVAHFLPRAIAAHKGACVQFDVRNKCQYRRCKRLYGGAKAVAAPLANTTRQGDLVSVLHVGDRLDIAHKQFTVLYPDESDGASWFTGSEDQKTLDPMSSKAAAKDVFAWTKQWYPVMLVSDLDAQSPTPHTLLNISMVVWQDGEGNWGACEDRCPHRSAAV